MTASKNPLLPDIVGEIVAGDHLAVLATTNPDGSAQTSVVFVIVEDDHLVFSTIDGRRKTHNMRRDPRVNVLLHRLDGGQPAYVTVSGTVELEDDPDASFHQRMYDRYMGGATPPPEPGAERLIARIAPRHVYEVPRYPPAEA